MVPARPSSCGYGVSRKQVVAFSKAEMKMGLG